MDLKFKNRLEFSLFFLRIGIFLVMLMWTIDKLVRVEHASAVFKKFYLIDNLGNEIFIGIAIVELILLLAFLIGYKKTFTYGFILILHAISTLSSYHQYLNPFEGSNLLFFAAWPMLGACMALFVLRDYDKKYCL